MFVFFTGNESFAASDHEARILSLSEQVTSLEQKLAESEVEKNTLQQRVELLLMELQSAENQGNRLSLFTQSRKVTFNCFTGDELAEVRETIKGKDAELGELAAKLSEAEAELFKLQAEIRDLRYAVDVKDEKVNELQCQLDEAVKETDRTRDIVGDLESKLKERELNEADEEKSGTVSHLQEALRQAREELSKADAEMSTKSEAIKQLEKSCGNLNRETSEMRSEIDKLKEDLADAEVVLAEKDAKLKNVQVLLFF